MDKKTRELCERIARNVSTLLGVKQWTRKRLANRAKLDQTQVSRIMALSHAPSLRTIAKLAESLEVDPAILVTRGV